MDLSKPVSSFCYVTITCFLVYVLYSLYYTIQRNYYLRQEGLNESPSSSASTTNATPGQVYDDIHLESLEYVMEQKQQNEQVKALRYRRLMNAFHYEVYSENTFAVIEAVSETSESDVDDADDIENGGRKKRTKPVFKTEAKKVLLLARTTSKKNIKKCCSNEDYCSPKVSSSEVDTYCGDTVIVTGKSCRTVVTKIKMIQDGDESTTILSRRLGNDDGETEPECVICLQPYKYGQVICCAKTGKCGHIFHADCMHQWLKNNDECPLCRATFLLEEEEEEKAL